MDDLTIAEPTTFDAFGTTEPALKTLLFRCESESIEHLSYRPRFTDSFFHLTVYDGPRSILARQAMGALRDQMTGYLLDLRGTATISRIRPAVPRITVGEQWIYMTDEARRFAANRLGLTPEDMIGLGASERLVAIRELTSLLMASHDIVVSEDSSRPQLKPFRHLEHEPQGLAAQFLQPSFWHDSEIPGQPSEAEEKAMRRATGTVLTPPEIALDMAFEGVQLHDDGPIFMGDPAVGTGLLYAALKNVAGEARIAHAEGFERDTARALATARRWRRGDLEVVARDFLQASLSQHAVDRSLILANPPYLRYEKQDREELHAVSELLRSKLGITPPPRSNLYVHFILSAHLWMRPGGVGVWLLPAEFMNTGYGRALREYLTQQVTLVSVHVYSDSELMFDNARVAPTLVAFKNVAPSEEATVRFSFGSRARTPQRLRLVDVPLLRISASWDPYVPWREAEPSPPPSEGVQIGDIFHVRRGLATGGNAFFVISTALKNELGVPDRWVKPVLPKSRFIESGIVEADADGLPILPRVDWLIDSGEPVDRVKEEAPQFAAYLREVPAAVARGYLVRRRGYIYRQENLESPMFVFVSMARAARTSSGGRFIYNKSRALALNNYHVLIPKARTLQWIESGIVTPTALYEALRCISVEQYDFVGRRHASALMKIEPGALRSLRIPIVDIPPSEG
ncbi:Eco57I restriction-modification methylase domain-containing protein [Cellulomonas cellasea]|uniref:Eco57I restriction-modification methylase domain-containing protein n=1 Tax=Cellulomonas cellasea TaxID=43670 RepID=UPI0014704E58|nr:Eco57I restriction-modification methylase domain-containing protein [Cellulomonas cellasea]